MRYFFILLLTMFGQCTAGPWDNSRCPPVIFPNGKVRSRGRGRIIRFNCFEGFTLVGNKYSTCVRGSWDTPIPVCVSSQCPSLPAPEHALVASKYYGAILMYFCEPGYVLIGTAEIYCNGRNWNGTAPYCRDTTAAAPTKCDFEKPDLCWWEQDPRHDFDWRRHNFETPSSHIGTGPTYDHTLGAGNDGYYLYIEASGRLVNDTARIISPLYNASLTNSGCFSFWYHMYGATIGALRVYFKPENGTSQMMFEKQGNQGNRWLHGIFDLPKSSSSFQIIIEGVRGASYVSDLAVDDVAILQGDECAEERKIDTVTGRSTANSNVDQIEIVNALQSCRGRCGNTPEVNTWTTIIPLNAPDACHCTLDCAENSSCCPDFAEYCVLGITDFPITTSKKITQEFAHEISSSTSSLTKYASYTHARIEPKDDIDPYVTNSPWKSPTTITKSTSKLTTIMQRRTATNKVIHVETPFVTKANLLTTDKPTMKTTTLYPKISSESQVLVEHVQQLHSAQTLGIPEIISIIVVLIAAIAIATTVVIVVFKRRKSYKRGSGKSNGSVLSEDSDVRFLTSDEVLDFNLARPSDSDEM
ncbi:MAM and LDL-receptor class A domain-containing protein 2-like [Chelonus insularis]|uniref:MAM and LDL-receptor class A domain-containing protein 2-like n=1 Tax=Chelonus insularis TaxID=460826 RepID=UPI0015888C6F|nr:MAM and LDL-receptor class A domain-containing protein 2-like [Chelonus insularis]